MKCTCHEIHNVVNYANFGVLWCYINQLCYQSNYYGNRQTKFSTVVEYFNKTQNY